MVQLPQNMHRSNQATSVFMEWVFQRHPVPNRLLHTFQTEIFLFSSVENLQKPRKAGSAKLVGLITLTLFYLSSFVPFQIVH